MKLTKDQARILAAALKVAKYDFSESCRYKEESLQTFNKLSELEDRLHCYGDDKHRKWRTSQEDWNDFLNRYVGYNNKS
jgi:hypothetical protein